MKDLVTMEMTKQLQRARCLGVALLAILVTDPSVSLAQNPPLQITSPATGTVFNPGQTVNVTAAATPGVTFTQVFSAAEDPIGFSSISTAAPFVMSITIPTNIKVGPYHLTALGAHDQGELVESDVVTIFVERTDAPQRLAAQPARIIFSSQGQQIPLKISATFADASVLDITQSSNIMYASSNSGVVAVDNTGIITAVAAGDTTVTARYGQSGLSISIPATVKRPALTVSPPALEFGNQAVGNASTTQALTVTNTSNAQLRITNVITTGDYIPTEGCTSSSPIAPGTKCTITVSFIPTGSGSRKGAVTIVNSFDVIPPAIPLSGTGVGQPTGTVTLNTASLTQTYDGSPKSVTVSTNPPGLAVSVTYNGSPTAPKNAGSYTVVATVIDPNHQGTASGLLTINKAVPTITWPKPPDVAFGTALGAGQLSAAANVLGAFVYSPSAGTVLPVGNGQVLSATFTPSDVTNYTTAAFSTVINVLPAPGSTVKIIVSSLLSRDASNNILVKLNLADSSAAEAVNVALTSVKIGTFSGTPLPQAIGTIGANSLVQTAVTVPGSAGAPGAASSLTIAGTYVGGTFSATSRITLP